MLRNARSPPTSTTRRAATPKYSSTWLKDLFADRQASIKPRTPSAISFCASRNRLLDLRKPGRILFPSALRKFGVADLCETHAHGQNTEKMENSTAIDMPQSTEARALESVGGDSRPAAHGPAGESRHGALPFPTHGRLPRGDNCPVCTVLTSMENEPHCRPPAGILTPRFGGIYVKSGRPAMDIS